MLMEDKPIILHIRLGHQHWSVGSESEWKYEDSDVEAKVGGFGFRGFGGMTILASRKDASH